MARKDSGARVASVDRRKFLSGVAIAGAASVTAPEAASALTAAAPRLPSALPPTAYAIAAETEVPKEIARVPGKPGSDFMVDVIKTLDIKYMPTNCASSFRAIHESLIDYGGNKMPEYITCTHEESAVAMAHGYFKVTGKPLLTLCHGVVGLQHATMAIYNAWCDRVPVIVVGGNDLDAAHRPPGVPTFHSAQDINAIVRDYTKWDDTPVSLQHFAQSFVRAYKIATTPPFGPVALSLDAGLQQEPIKDGEKLYIPRFTPSSPPQGDTGAVKEAARLLANAERPVIVVERSARTENGIGLLVQLAEALQAPVVDLGGRMNFPKTHYLGRPATVVNNADVILGMEVADFWGVVNSFTDNGEDGIGVNSSKIKPDTKLISINASELLTKSNYQDFQRFQAVDVSMPADAEATMPALIEAVKSAISNDRRLRLTSAARPRKKHLPILACAPGRLRRLPGTPARSAPHGSAWRFTARSRTLTGPWLLPVVRSATGRTGFGRWRSTRTGLAARAAPASAMARLPRSAPRWQTVTLATSRSASRAMAI
jgi:acetolactate synthase-1/2/3 large subunit